MRPTAVGTGNAVPELLLKTTPPRPPRHLFVRPRLGLEDEQFRDRILTVVQAPAGFGKTSLLGQWRREHLAQGAAVAWISADGHDDPTRFLLSLVLAVRNGCGRPGFGHGLADGARSLLGELDGITAWLAEVGQTALKLVLMVDEADRMTPARLEGLSYLIRNAPPNLRFVIAGRSGLEPLFADLVAYGHCLTVGSEMLRFRFDEMLGLVRGQFGNRVDADACARLYEVVEGWPLGLQIALSAMEGHADPRAAIDSLSAPGQGQREQLVAGLLAKFVPADLDFLTCLSVVDLLHPDLCVALTGRADGPETLARLMREAPIFMAGDASEWLRLHNLARDALRSRFERLAEAERRTLHNRAMRWFVARGMVEQAAHHAHAGGAHEVACELAEQGVYDAVLRGQLAAVAEWLEILPAEELQRFPRLRLAAAWALALSERHAEAGAMVADILEGAAIDANLHYECALILSGAAYFADQPDRCVASFAPWIDAPPPKDLRLRQMHANRLSMLALLAGDPAQARHHQQVQPRLDADADSTSYAARWGGFVVGLSYLWEGQPKLAEEQLRPLLSRSDSELGRRHPLSCMLAAVLAAAVYEGDRLDEAAALLANRLDVLARAGTPETALLGYRAAARIAAAQGMEHRALSLLEALHAIGTARRLPRLCVVSLTEQVRLHAARSRGETCQALVAQIDQAMTADALTGQVLLLRVMHLSRLMAHAWAAIALQDWRRAGEVLQQAAPLALALKFGRVRIEIMGLQGIALERSHENGKELVREAWTLAQTYGLMRTLVDAHPLLVDAIQRLAGEGSASRALDALGSAHAIRPRERTPAPAKAVPCMVLTPKERQVLELLVRNYSNKEIAQALEVVEETVKWHLKNLFAKLDAVSRKHAVRRAELLGLLEDAS